MKIPGSKTNVVLLFAMRFLALHLTFFLYRQPGEIWAINSATPRCTKCQEKNGHARCPEKGLEREKCWLPLLLSLLSSRCCEAWPNQTNKKKSQG